MGKGILRTIATWRPMTQEWYDEMERGRRQRERDKPGMTTAEWKGLLVIVTIVLLLMVLGATQHGYAPPGYWGY